MNTFQYAVGIPPSSPQSSSSPSQQVVTSKVSVSVFYHFLGLQSSDEILGFTSLLVRLELPHTILALVEGRQQQL